MPVAMMEFLNHQAGESYRAFLIHGPARSGKTRFARRAQEKIGRIAYLDLLEYFLAHPELPRIVDFKPAHLKLLLTHYTCEEPVVLIDNLDFLLNVWSGPEKRAFVDLIDHDLRSPGDTSKIFGFFIQTDPEITARQFQNTRKESRVLSIDHIQMA